MHKLRKRFFALSLVIVALFTGGYFAQFLLRDAIAENPTAHVVRNFAIRNTDGIRDALGLIDFEPPRYIPGQGTRVVFRAHPDPDVTSGVLFEYLIYADDIGGVVRRVEGDGSLGWTHRSAFGPRSLQSAGGEVYFADGDKITFLSAETGEESHSVDPSLGMLSCVSEVHQGTVYVCQRTFEGENVFSVNLATAEASNVAGLNTGAARSVVLLDDQMLAVADTYGHRVLVKDLDTGAITEIPEFFPNDATFTREGQLLILGEHSNRLVSHNLQNGETNFLFGFRHPRNLGAIEPTSYEAFSAFEMRLDHAKFGIVSRADSRVVGPETLYSPNYFYTDQQTGCIVIADTDNHRLVILDESFSFISEIAGLINVVSALVTFPEDADLGCRL
jgi:hypothetical protein